MRGPWHILLTLALAVTTFAGCLDNDDESDDEPAIELPETPIDWAERAVAALDDHDHGDLAQHMNRSTGNFHELGWDPLHTDYHEGTSGGYLCGDVSEDAERRIGVTHSFDTDVALVIVDLTDPASPEKLGEVVMPSTFIYDVAITPDAQYAILGTNDPDAEREKTPVLQALKAPPASIRTTASTEPVYRDACTGQERPLSRAQHLDGADFGPGVVLVELSDPSNPHVADYKPLAGLGAHSVFATQFGDDYRVLASVTNLQQHASYYAFYTIQADPTGALGADQLIPQALYTPQPPAEAEQAIINGHVDGWIATHPATDTKTAFLANWDGGLILLDVEDPNQPQELGRWTDFAGQDDIPYDDDTGSIHEALPFPDLVDGRHYTIIGQEVIGPREGAPTGAVFVMDTTDPTNPHPVAAWTMPVEPVWDEDILYSTHYVTLDEEMLFVTMYHGGVWAVDLTDPTNPRTRGVYVPAHPDGESAVERAGFDWTPVVLEAEVIAPSTLAVWDGNTGIYTVRYDRGVPVPEVDEWDLSAAIAE